MNRLLVGIALAAIMAAGACGDEPLDSEAFRTKANAICAKRNADIEALEERLKSAEGATREKIEAELGQVTRRTVARLLALNPDNSADQEILNRLKRANELHERFLKTNDRAVFDDLTEESNNIEERFEGRGITECAKAS